VLAGAFFFVAGTAGLIRFPDTLSRVHALTKADNLGLGLIVLGLLPLAPGLGAARKLLLVWVLVVIGGATAAQLIGAAAARDEHAMPSPPTAGRGLGEGGVP
jgi:multicomponent Na+:H+ antiporter subunit G